MAYNVSEETMRLYGQVNELAKSERRLTKMFEALQSDLKRIQGQYVDLLLALGETRTLLRQKEEELEKAVNS